MELPEYAFQGYIARYGLAVNIEKNADGERVLDNLCQGYWLAQSPLLLAHRDAWSLDKDRDYTYLDIKYTERGPNESCFSLLFKKVMGEVLSNVDGEAAQKCEYEFRQYVADNEWLRRNRSGVADIVRDADYQKSINNIKTKLGLDENSPIEDHWIAEDYLVGRVMWNRLHDYVEAHPEEFPNNPELDKVLPGPDGCKCSRHAA